MKQIWSLKEISAWVSDNSIVKIPTIQRGLVWKPQQVEMLWDSILRSFPIGAFTLSSSENNTYYLLDGQQRWNAIASGYGLPSDIDSQRVVLWLDLKPEEVWDLNKTTRRFFVRATTKAHPWGYWNDDECSRLDTYQKRVALEEFGLSGRNIYREGISLTQAYPVRSGIPLPLQWFVAAGETAKDDDDFIKIIKERIRNNSTEENLQRRFMLKNVEVSDDLIRSYVPTFRGLSTYSVPIIYLSQKVIDENGETEKTVDGERLSDIEILFSRIGTGGTQITQNELIYSTIKAYWPSELVNMNEALAAKYMPPFSLIMLAFRLALSPSKDGVLCSPLSIRRVREIASSKGDEYSKIIKLYGDGRASLENILTLVNGWLTSDNSGRVIIPPVLRTSIARNSPDVFLFLMYIAGASIRDEVKMESADVTTLRAAAFYIHWLVDKGSRGWVVNRIIRNLATMRAESYSSAIKSALMDSYACGVAMPLQLPDDFSKLFGNQYEVGSDATWKPWDNGRADEEWWPLWTKVCKDREILIYAQRRYMCDKFANYDPAKMDMWEEYNRPWDYDHIIPQDWIYRYHGKRNTFSDYCIAWKDCNGNMAAIPFETNRSKNNEADWQEYIKEKQALFADDEIEEYGNLFTREITSDQEQSNLFAKKTYIRLCKIYSEIYDLLRPMDVNDGSEQLTLSNGLAERRKRMMNISKSLDADVYYVSAWKEEKVHSLQDWSREWMSTGIVTRNGYYAAITMQISDLNLARNIEIGLRRYPGTSELSPKEVPDEMVDKLNSKDSDIQYEKCSCEWWQLFLLLPITTPDKALIDLIKKLALFADNELK